MRIASGPTASVDSLIGTGILGGRGFVQHVLESIEAGGPERAGPREPGVDLGEAGAVDRVDPSLGLAPDADDTAARGVGETTRHPERRVSFCADVA